MSLGTGVRALAALVTFLIIIPFLFSAEATLQLCRLSSRASEDQCQLGSLCIGILVNTYCLSSLFGVEVGLTKVSEDSWWNVLTSLVSASETLFQIHVNVRFSIFSSFACIVRGTLLIGVGFVILIFRIIYVGFLFLKFYPFIISCTVAGYIWLEDPVST